MEAKWPIGSCAYRSTQLRRWDLALRSCLCPEEKKIIDWSVHGRLRDVDERRLDA